MYNETKKTLYSFYKGESGATAIEYSVIAAMISVAIVSFVPTIGDSVLGLFTTLDTEIK